MPVITVSDVSKSYKHQVVFQGVSASFDAGRIHGLVGHNGSGKSVLLKMICGFVRPDSGAVRIDPAFRRPQDRFPRDFGIILDRPGYLPGRTGMDNLRELARIRGLVGDEQILATARTFGIADALDRKVRHYSLGMKQKLALTQALMEDQQVLLLDEPFNGLDESSVHDVRAALATCRDAGKTVVFTSHQKEDMDVLADTVHRFDRQRLLQVR